MIHREQAHHVGRRATWITRRGSALLVAFGLVLTSSVRTAHAQDSISEVLAFLVTNRSIPTGDFAGDEQAASATSATISGFLLIELATLPISSSSGGFSYRVDPALGTAMRSSDSFGPFFVERSLTSGEGQSSFSVSYHTARFDNIDGRNLRDGTLVSTASGFRSEAQPFDVETVTLRLSTNTMTVFGNYGVTDRLDVSAAVPFVRLSLSGQRLDNYRGQEFVQATGSGSASGLGDIVLRAKYNVLRSGASGLAIGGETRLPTGSRENLLGSGEVTVQPRLIASYEGLRFAVHGNIGQSFGGLSDELDYQGAITVVAAPRLTLVGELIGRRLASFGRLADTTQPHPSLTGIDTIRLTGVQQATNRVVAVAGLKWNLARTLLISANILRPITSAGLNARWVPTVSLDYSFGR